MSNSIYVMMNTVDEDGNAYCRFGTFQMLNAKINSSYIFIECLTGKIFEGDIREFYGQNMLDLENKRDFEHM